MAAERIIVANPLASAGGRVIATPFQFVLDGTENLRIVSVNSASGVALTLQGRMLDSAGKIRPIRETHLPNSDRSAKTQDYAFGAGTILNLSVVATAGSPSIGQTFVIVEVIQGLSGNTQVLGTLLQGYVTTVQQLAWPGSPLQNSFDTNGVVRVITGTAPGLGQDVVVTVPVGARWQVLAFRVVLTTDAVGVTRVPLLQLSSSGIIYIRSLIDPGVPPGTVAQLVMWYPGASNPAAFTNAASVGVIPNETFVLAGDTLIVTAANGDAGDQFGAPIYVVREWLEVN